MTDTHHIGEVASRTGLSLRALRHYEEMGVVRPSGRTEGGFRLYSEADVRKLLLVRSLKPTEFSIDELREVIELCDRAAGGALDADAAARLADVIGLATQRLRIQRERLIAAELAVDLLRERVGASGGARPAEASDSLEPSGAPVAPGTRFSTAEEVR